MKKNILGVILVLALMVSSITTVFAGGTTEGSISGTTTVPLLKGVDFVTDADGNQQFRFDSPAVLDKLLLKSIKYYSDSNVTIVTFEGNNEICGADANNGAEYYYAVYAAKNVAYFIGDITAYPNIVAYGTNGFNWEYINGKLQYMTFDVPYNYTPYTEDGATDDSGDVG